MIKKTFLSIKMAAIFELALSANLKRKIIAVNIPAVIEYIYIKVFHNFVRYNKKVYGGGGQYEGRNVIWCVLLDYVCAYVRGAWFFTTSYDYIRLFMSHLLEYVRGAIEYVSGAIEYVRGASWSAFYVYQVYFLALSLNVHGLCRIF